MWPFSSCCFVPIKRNSVLASISFSLTQAVSSTDEHPQGTLHDIKGDVLRNERNRFKGQTELGILTETVDIRCR